MGRQAFKNCRFTTFLTLTATVQFQHLENANFYWVSQPSGRPLSALFGLMSRQHEHHKKSPNVDRWGETYSLS